MQNDNVGLQEDDVKLSSTIRKKSNFHRLNSSNNPKTNDKQDKLLE